MLNLHGDVLAAMRRGPRPFAKLACALSESGDPGDTVLNGFRDRLVTATSTDELVSLWQRSLTAWDFEEHAPWSDAPPRTQERRVQTYGRLGFGPDLCKALDTAAPVAMEQGAVVISRTFERWYTRETAANRSFYWTAYQRLLRQKGWSDAAVSSLDEASHAVVERLSDPARTEAYGARGLVVGYVQSGKTANFTGVTAKAIDAGYRLVITLGGTLNLLRSQTQRRLDMELIGRENILRGADPQDPGSLIDADYQDDEDWPDKFVSHGARPSTLGAFDIERLTTRDEDYKSLLSGIRALEFEKQHRTLPLYSPENLHHAAARIMVVKKNKSVLTKLVKDLKKIGPILHEIPALIIDDESDQASVNTVDPKKWEAGKVSRTAINGLISQLLTLLPRAQYVGYTATPFANVFVDPGDGEDIFPRDFLISLPRPSGYMGVQDFHDLDDPSGQAEERHIRGIYEDTGDRLQEAIDSFLLTGALKLYRADHGVREEAFRHHTMLVHESVRTDDHAELALRINSMWHQAGYTGQEGHARLGELFASDFQRYSGGDLPMPDSYAALKPYVSRARQLINSGGNPVIVVNGDTDRYFEQIDLDFDRTPHVWKILVGGTKLSRGFTVEGLTVTYYLRTTRQADTLMQMGRWFGFRPGYRDLVRLFIGREVPLSAQKTVDLYEAFEAICRDEEAFRSQLAAYSNLVDGVPQLTPREVPPLVSQHLPWIRPAARNKMFNAQLVEIRTPGEWVEPTAYPDSSFDLRHNTELWEPVLASLSHEPTPFVHLPPGDKGSYTTYLAKTCVIPHDELVKIFGKLAWGRPDLFAPHLQFLRDPSEAGCATDDWVVIAPQASRHKSVTGSILGCGPFSLARRSRTRGVFNRISGVAHRQSAERIAGAQDLVDDDPFAAQLHRARRGAVLLYPVLAADEETPAPPHNIGPVEPGKVVIAASFISAIDRQARTVPLVRFRTIDSSAEGEAIIDAR
jgi:hypothetical protein